MKYYTDEELERLLADTESFRVERKESWSGTASEKGQQAVCAFANDLPDTKEPGFLFVGVDDAGVPTGEDITDRLLQQLGALKEDGNITPPPSLTVEKRRLLGNDVAVVMVQPAISPPVRYKGRIWIRTGPRRGLATEQDERILTEKRRHGNRPFDATPVFSASPSDLDRRLFEEEYLPSAFAADVLTANERSVEQRLAVTKMVDSAEDPVPTVLGILVLAPRCRDFLPGAYVQFLRVAGREISDDPVVDELMADGTIGEVIRKTEAKFKAHNRVAVDFTTEPLERRTSTYPLDALEQIFRNAVMHRAYEGTHAPIRVTWYDDRVEIQNVGGPYGAVTSENLADGTQTDYRNPGLADALRVLGFVQRFGAGIRTAKASMERNGNPPIEFDVHQNHILVTLRRSPK